KMQKFMRPKKRWAQYPDSLLADDFSPKAQALANQRDKLGRRIDTLVTTRNYAGFDLRQDQEMWWLYYFASPPPRYMPLWGYYDRHPGVTVVVADYVDLRPSPAEAVAAPV